MKSKYHDIAQKLDVKNDDRKQASIIAGKYAVSINTEQELYEDRFDSEDSDELVPMAKLYKDKDLLTFCEALQHNLLFDSLFQIGNGTVHCPCGQFGSKWQKIFDLEFSVECE